MNLKIAVAAIILTGLAVPLQAKEKKWDIPCQKVFVTGTQRHEIAWALKGDGVENNLYKRTCMQPVSDASQAEAILDIEVDPKLLTAEAQRERRKFARNPESTDFWVSCSSDAHGSYCFDSLGYELDTECNNSGCSSYFGPSAASEISDILFNLLDELGRALDQHLADISAWGYMFSAKDHRLI